MSFKFYHRVPFIVLLAGTIYIGEFVIMLLLSLFPPLSPYTEAVTDASLLILIIAPFLYLLSFRPMVKEIVERKKAQEMLTEREKKLNTITETAGDAIICLEEPDIITLWNRKAEEMFGFTIAEAVGKELHRLIVPERYREKSYEGLVGFFKTGLGTVVGKTVEIEALHRDGSEFPIELSVSAMKIGDKWLTTGIVRDITDRKKAAVEIERQRDDLRRINDELSMLYKVSMAISRTIDLHKLLYDILFTILGIEMLNVERRGGIFVVEEGRMTLVSQVGFSEEFVKLHKGIKVGDCLCGLAAKTGEIVVSKEADDDPRHTIHYTDMTNHGHVIIPLKAAEKVVGVLCLYTPEGVELSNRSIETLMSIGGQIGIAIENSRLYEETKALALHDPLTGLANRRYMEIFLERGFNEARRYNRMFSVILLDIDYFKKYNDEFGHPAGDVLLARIAKIISEGVRDVDLTARYGGEEFIVLLPEVDYSQVHIVAERLRMSVAEYSGVTISLGVSSFTPEMQVKEDLINIADTALYLAKQKGRNRVEMGQYSKT